MSFKYNTSYNKRELQDINEPNSIKGLHDPHKNQEYRSKCAEMQCYVKGCCYGYYNSMKCGTQEFCEKLGFKDDTAIIMGFAIALGLAMSILMAILFFAYKKRFPAAMEEK
jgi:hypothetical protein